MTEKHFSFSNLLGKVYTQGNVVFPNCKENKSLSECILSPVGNRVSTFDIANNTAKTTLYGHPFNIDSMTLSPDGKMLITSSRQGETTFMTYPQGIILRKMRFPPLVHGIYWSDDSRYFIVTGNRLSLYKVDHNYSNTLASKPLLLDELFESRYYSCVDWIDSKYVAVGSPLSVHLYQLNTINHTPKLTNGYTLSGYKSTVICCNFLVENGVKKMEQLFTLDDSGKAIHWIYSSDSKKWMIQKKKRLKSCTCATINFEKSLLVLGVNGGYMMYSLEDFSLLNSLNITQTMSPVTSIAFNSTGDWIAVAISALGQLLVWDWNSETYIFKQQNHTGSITAITYSQIGDVLASGDSDGKIKVWDCKSGQSFVTLDKHKGPITGITFSRAPGSRDPALFTSSFDGTVRAFDMLRYKNFRTYDVPDSQIAFSSVAVDPSGEIIAAGGQNEYDIYLWNVQTKQLLETLKSHEGPVTALAFSPTRSLLVSASWDKTAKVWDIFGSKATAESLDHNTEVVAVAFRPDGEEICTACTDGSINFWDVEESAQIGHIDCKRDITTEHNIGEEKSLVKLESKKYFTSVCYTSDGTCVLCGGKSQFLNMYSVSQKVLLKRFILSTNLSISGVRNLEKFYGALYDPNEAFAKNQHNISKQKKPRSKIEKIIGDQDVPGSKVELMPEISCESIAFSPTNKEFSVATAEGIMTFSTDTLQNFQPLDIDVTITPENILKQLQKERFGDALMMAIRLNEESILSKVFNSIPTSSIELVARSIPDTFIELFITFLSKELDTSIQLDYILRWIKALIYSHGQYILGENEVASTIYVAKVGSSSKIASSLRSLLRSLHSKFDNLSKISNENEYTLQYISTFDSDNKLKNIHEEEAEHTRKRMKTTSNSSEGNNDDKETVEFHSLSPQKKKQRTKQ